MQQVHIDNLNRLADYLLTSANVSNFDMRVYYEDEGDWLDIAQIPVAHKCGTAACAVGHAPYAGIFPEGINSFAELQEREYSCWDVYLEDVFGVPDGTRPYRLLFSDRWGEVDNTPAGAAKRIKYFIHHDIDSSREVNTKAERIAYQEAANCFYKLEQSNAG